MRNMASGNIRHARHRALPHHMLRQPTAFCSLFRCHGYDVILSLAVVYYPPAIDVFA